MARIHPKFCKLPRLDTAKFPGIVQALTKILSSSEVVQIPDFV